MSTAATQQLSQPQARPTYAIGQRVSAQTLSRGNSFDRINGRDYPRVTSIKALRATPASGRLFDCEAPPYPAGAGGLARHDPEERLNTACPREPTGVPGSRIHERSANDLRSQGLRVWEVSLASVRFSQETRCA